MFSRVAEGCSHMCGGVFPRTVVTPVPIEAAGVNGESVGKGCELCKDEDAAMTHIKSDSKETRSLELYARRPDAIAGRLEELDREWDFCQAAAAASVGMSLATLATAFSRRGRWAVLPLTALQAVLVKQTFSPGGSPLGKLAGRCGLRTRREIESERFALKALRGDFQNLPSSAEARGVAPVLAAVAQ